MATTRFRWRPTWNTETYSTLHHDLTHDEPMALDALLGAVCRHAAAGTDVDVSMHEAVVAIPYPQAERNTR